MTLGHKVLFLFLSLLLFRTSLTQSFDVIPQTSHVNGTKTAAFSPDGNYLVTSGFDCLIKIRKYPSGEVINQIKTAPGVVNSIAFISETRIVTGDSKGNIAVFDIFSGKRILSRKISYQQINSVIYDRKSSLFWCTGFGGLLTGVETDSLFIHHIARNFRADINAADLSADGSLFLGSTSGLIYRFDTFSRMIVDSVEAFESDVSGIRALPVTGTLLASSYSGEIKRYRLDKNIFSQSYRVKPEPASLITSMALSPSGNVAVFSTFDNTIILFDTEAGKVTKSFPAHEYMIAGMLFKNESELLSYSFGHRSFVWDINNVKAPIRSYDGITGTVNRIAPGKKWLIFSEEDGSVFATDLTNNLSTKSLTRSLFPVTALALDDDNNRVAVGTADGNVIIADPATSGVLYQEQFGDREILSVDLQKDFLVVCGGDRKVRIINISFSSGKTSVIQSPMTGRFTSCAIAHSSGLIAVGSSEGVIYFLDRINGNKVSTLAGHSMAVNSVAFDANEKIFVSASADRTVRFWSTDEILNFKTVTNELGYVSGAFFTGVDKVIAAGEGGTVIFSGTGKNDITKPEQNDISIDYPGLLGKGHFAGLEGSGQISVWNLKSGKRDYIIIPTDEKIELLDIREKTLYSDGGKASFLFPDAENTGTTSLPRVRPLKDLKVAF